MAKEAGINLANVTGSGDNGRIVKRDVEALIGSGAKTTPAPVSAPTPKKAPTSTVEAFTFGNGEANYEDISISQMRKAIAVSYTHLTLPTICSV